MVSVIRSFTPHHRTTCGASGWVTASPKERVLSGRDADRLLKITLPRDFSHTVREELSIAHAREAELAGTPGVGDNGWLGTER